MIIWRECKAICLIKKKEGGGNKLEREEREKMADWLMMDFFTQEILVTEW